MRSTFRKHPAQQEGPTRDGSSTVETGDGTSLEQRLAGLVQSEREGQEKLQELQDRRRAAHQQDAARRLRALEDALGDARIETAKREEAERAHAAIRAGLEEALGRVRMEAATFAIELGQAQRDAEEARRSAKPRAARKIAEAEKRAADAHAQVKRERAEREKLERDLVALERSDQAARAEAERERAKRAELEQRIEAFAARAVSTRQKHEEQIEKLERARAEAERIAAEAQQAVVHQSTERNREGERLRAIEQLLHAATGPERLDQEAAPDTSTEPGPPTEEPIRGAERKPVGVKGESVEASAIGKDGVGGRRRRRNRVFQARGRSCAVCRNTEAKSPGALKADGWALGSEIDLCPECQEQGWQLPKGGSLPFRRSSDRDQVS